jgi:mRNA-degrading endonuclease RelE of RelBE toxin-antitoxin system
MDYTVNPAPSFQRQLKAILKKYPLIRSDLENYLKELKYCLPGDRIPGHPNLVKDRFALKPYKIGQRGGLRLISYNVVDTPSVFPLLIYSKSDMPIPPHKMIIDAVKELESFLEE